MFNIQNTNFVYFFSFLRGMRALSNTNFINTIWFLTTKQKHSILRTHNIYSKTHNLKLSFIFKFWKCHEKVIFCVNLACCSYDRQHNLALYTALEHFTARSIQATFWNVDATTSVCISQRCNSNNLNVEKKYIWNYTKYSYCVKTN